VITFEALECSTLVTLRTIFPTAEQRRRAAEEFHAVEGGQQTLHSLARYVAAGSVGDAS
jgi:hypothetical protein